MAGHVLTSEYGRSISDEISVTPDLADSQELIHQIGLRVFWQATDVAMSASVVHMAVPVPDSANRRGCTAMPTTVTVNPLLPAPLTEEGLQAALKELPEGTRRAAEACIKCYKVTFLPFGVRATCTEWEIFVFAHICYSKACICRPEPFSGIWGSAATQGHGLCPRLSPVQPCCHACTKARGSIACFPPWHLSSPGSSKSITLASA